MVQRLTGNPGAAGAAVGVVAFCRQSNRSYAAKRPPPAGEGSLLEGSPEAE